MNGRKRHLLVDTLGLILRVQVHPANVSDRDGGVLLLTGIAQRYPRLRWLWADLGYTGWGMRHAARAEGLELALTVPPLAQLGRPGQPKPKGFVILPRRWVVERTFAWLGRYRRLSKDYEALPATEEAWIYAASSMLMLARLVR